jgi:hypothetical protein
MTIDETEFLLTSDVGREAQLTPNAIKAAADRGELKVCLRTIRGVRVFTREAVDAYLQRRAQRERVSAGA